MSFLYATRLLAILLCLSVSLGFFAGCANEKQNRVVLYCSVDDVYSRPIIRELEEKTGLQIDALYDVEAAKTAGLANRIRAEKERPRGDVFWSSALLQTLLLQREGLLHEYSSPSAQDVPTAFKDESGAWAGMGVRDRVLVYHQKVAKPPSTLQELLQPRFRNQVAISDPQFGTGSDWVAALSVRWGEKRTLDYFLALKKNGVKIVPGNGVVAERVAHGELLAGVTDTDDFYAQQKQVPGIRLADSAAPLEINAVTVPGSVAILKNAPNLENAKKLTDALLSLETEQRLMAEMRGVESLREIKNPPPADTDEWADSWLQIREPLAEILLTP